MDTTRTIEPFRLDVSLWSVALIFVLIVAIGASEALLFFGHVWYTISAYSLLLFALSLVALFLESEMTIFQAFALIPVFRLVNLTMPVFFDMTLFWLPFIYGPFILVVVYLGRQTSIDDHEILRTGVPSEALPSQRSGKRESPETVDIGHELPWWLGGNRTSKPRWLLVTVWQSLAAPEDASRMRSVLHGVARGLFTVLLPLAVVALLVSMGVLTIYLAEYEYGLLTPPPLVPSLNLYYVALLTVIMVGFVGFVEELLFRGVLQKVLERRLGIVPGLLIASGIFGLLHSGHGIPNVITFACGVGLLFGIIYDVTDSLVLVSVMHGLLNVLLFGVIPLNGGSSIDLLRSIVAQALHRVGIQWIVEPFLLLDLWMVTGVF